MSTPQDQFQPNIMPLTPPQPQPSPNPTFAPLTQPQMPLPAPAPLPASPPPSMQDVDPLELINTLSDSSRKSKSAKARDMLTNALTGFVFSLGKGMEAQAQYPGQRGQMAGVGAALQAPQQLQALQQQAQARVAAIQDQQAQTKQRSAQAALDQMKAQTVPMTNADGSPMLTDPNDPNSVLMLPMTQATSLKRSQLQTKTQVDIANAKIADIDKRAEEKNKIVLQGLAERNALDWAKLGKKEVLNDPKDPTAGTHVENQSPDEYSPAFKSKLEDDAIKNALLKAQTDLAIAKNDPNSPLFKQAQQRIAVLQQGMVLKAQEQATGKPLPMTDENRAVSAAMIIQLAPQIQQEIERNSAKLGAIVGKGEDFMLKSGIKDPELRQLQVDLASIAPFVSQMHAARGTQGMIQEFGKVTSRLGEAPENAVVAIKANAGIAQQVLDEIQSQHPTSIVTGSTKNRQQAPPPKPPVANAPTATGPGGIKLVLKNGKWVPQ